MNKIEYSNRYIIIELNFFFKGQIIRLFRISIIFVLCFKNLVNG